MDFKIILWTFIFYTRTNIDSQRKCIQKNAAIIQENFTEKTLFIGYEHRSKIMLNCKNFEKKNEIATEKSDDCAIVVEKISATYQTI